MTPKLPLAVGIYSAASRLAVPGIALGDKST
jgi:hypothetical protein